MDTTQSGAYRNVDDLERGRVMGLCRSDSSFGLLLAFGLGAFFELLPVNMVAAVLVPLFSWVATWLTFTQAMRTRARRSIDYPNDM